MEGEVDPERVKKAYEDLWGQFEITERKYDQAIQALVELVKDLDRRETLAKSLKDLRDQRDDRIEHFKTRIFDLQRKLDSRGADIELYLRYLEEDASAKKAALETIAILQDDLQDAREQLKVRDYWFEANKPLMKEVAVIIQQRAIEIKTARMGPREFKLDVPEGEELEGGVKVEGDVEGVEIIPAKPVDGKATILIPYGEFEIPDGVGAAKVEPPEEYLEQLEIGLVDLARKFYPAIGQAVGDTSQLTEADIYLIRCEELDAGSTPTLIINNTPLLEDNNFKLGLHRAYWAGLEEEEGRPPVPGDIQDSVSSRLILVPEDPANVISAEHTVCEPADVSPHPYANLAMNAAARYLIDNKELKINIYDVVMSKELDGSALGF